MEHALCDPGNHDHGVAQGIEVSGETGYRYLTRVSRPHVWEAPARKNDATCSNSPSLSGSPLGGKRFYLVHATPRDPLDEYLMKDPQLWARRVHNVDADVVCVGHSHLQFNLSIDGTVVINPGSVGQPRDGDRERRTQ